MHPWTPVALIGAAIVFGHPADAAGAIQLPPTAIIPEKIACPECRVDLRLIATLGDDDGDGALSGQPRFVVRMEGSWVVADYPTPQYLIVYDSLGNFLRRVGRSGSGPGEFQFITAAYVDGEGFLHIFDAGLRRESVFDSQYELVKTTPRPDIIVHNALRDASTNQVFYNGVVATPAAIGLPVHLMDDTSIVRSFGSSTPMQRPDAPELERRALAPTAAGVWITRPTHYRIELWGTDGAIIKSMEREPDWFRPYLIKEMPTPNQPPPPWIGGMTEVQGGRLMVLILVAADDFDRKLQPRATINGKVLYDFGPCAELYDTIVEVVDPLDGGLVSHETRDECLLNFSESLVIGYRQDRGFPRVDLYEFRVPSVP
jgi:hypothetical protein